MSTTPLSFRIRSHRGPKKGISLLVCLFVVVITSVLLTGILDTVTSHLSAVRNSMDYERALYLAGAGVHHALALIEDQPTWTGDIPATEFPFGSGYTYSASAVAAGDGTVVITAVGTSGTITRKLQGTVQPGG